MNRADVRGTRMRLGPDVVGQLTLGGPNITASERQLHCLCAGTVYTTPTRYHCRAQPYLAGMARMPDRIRSTMLPPRPSAARLPYLDLWGRPAVASDGSRGHCGGAGAMALLLPSFALRRLR